MRKALLVSILLISSLPLFAAKPFKVTKGSLNVFKQDVTATFEMSKIN